MCLALVAASAGVFTGSGPIGADAINPLSSLVPITPCRLLDTRPAPDNVGTRVGALAAGETFTTDVWGTHGNCTIPTGATGVVTNTVAIQPTAASFLTVFPAGATRPTTASLNWVAGQAPTPNAVTSALSADGRISFFNLAGTVHLAVDIVGYYVPSTPAPAGPQGDQGDTGPAGPNGTPGADAPTIARVLHVAPTGARYSTVGAALAAISGNGANSPYVIDVAPGTYVEPNGITLKDHVDIQGSGRGITVITSPAPITVTSTGTVTAELRHLTIANTAATSPQGVKITSSGGVRLSDVAVTVSGGGEPTGIEVYLSAATLDDVEVTASAPVGAVAFPYGVWVHGDDQIPAGAQVTADDVDVTVSGGGVTDPNANRSGTGGVVVEGVSLFDARHVVIDDVDADQAFALLSNFSSTVNLRDADVTVNGGRLGFGLANSSSSVINATNVRVQVDTTRLAIGVWDNGGVAFNLVRSHVAVNGTSVSSNDFVSGVVVASGPMVIDGSDVVAVDHKPVADPADAVGYGVNARDFADTSVDIRNSTVGGSTNSVFVELTFNTATSHAVVGIANSVVDGIIGGPRTCSRVSTPTGGVVCP